MMDDKYIRYVGGTRNAWKRAAGGPPDIGWKGIPRYPEGW